MCREARALPTREADLVPNASRQDPRPVPQPQQATWRGAHPAECTGAGEQVQGKPSSANRRRGRNYRCHLGVEAGARAGKRKSTENHNFFFFYVNKLFFLKEGGLFPFLFLAT